MSVLTASERTLGKSGIPRHETWGVIDSSKLQSLMDCPRSFFFNYVLGWTTETPRIDLEFGSAWHKAMEVLLTEGHSPASTLKAYQAFMDYYLPAMNMNEMVLNDLHRAKTPANAFRALGEYTGTWKDNPANTLHVEVAGTVPIREDRVIHTKTDAIRQYPRGTRDEGMVYSLEHKTGGRLDKTFEEKWHYIFQVGTYDYFLKMLYDFDRVRGVTINGAIFRVSGNAFPRIPITRSMDMVELWLAEANHFWDYLEYNMEVLADQSPSDRVMIAFPRNSASCSKFGCRHPELCSVVANPIQRCEQVPLGYKRDFWDPRKREQEVKKAVHIEKGETLA